MSWSARSEEGRSRRDVLKALGAAAAGAVAAGVLNEEKAEASHGTINATSNTDNPAIHAENTAFGPGIEASSEGTAVTAVGDTGVLATGGDTGVFGKGGTMGVRAEGVDYGVLAYGYTHGVIANSSELGVQARADGESGVGVNAGGRWIGVYSEGGEVGVKAISTQGSALLVEGRASFTTAGSGSIPAGQDSASVGNSKVTALSHVTVTFTGDPGQASSAPGSRPVVVWVERQPGTGFVVHMSRGVRFATPFTYLIVEPV